MGLAVTTTIAAVTGVAKGISSVVSKTKKSKQTIEDLNREIDRLGKDKDDLTKSYNQSKLTLENQSERAIKNLNWNIGMNLEAQGRKSSSDALMNVGQQDLGYKDLTSLIANAAQKEGSAVQASALTGFRNSGSNQNRQKIAEAENSNAIDKAQETLKLSSAQMFQEASTSYWNYDAKVEGYQNNISDAQAELGEALASLKNQYDTNMRNIDQNIEDANIAKDRADYGFWDGFWDVLSFGAATTVDTIDTYNSTKLQYDTKTSYENLTNYLKESNI